MEEVQAGVVNCAGCDWHWNLKDGLDGGETNAYLCHKCWHDNTPAITESQAEVTAAKRMLDLGLIEPQDFKQTLRDTGLDKRYRSEFVEALKALFSKLGIEWKDFATDRQAKNGTIVLKFSSADAAEILFTADLPKGLSPTQEARYAKIKTEMRQWQRQMEIETSTEGRRPFEYWIFPGSLRNSGLIGSPTSNRQVVFDGLTDPTTALARFMYQVALDAHGRSWRWSNQ